jgi:hypothetical protein
MLRDESGRIPSAGASLHAVATCACANVLSEQKSAMVDVTLTRTMAQAMCVENEACAS